MKVAILTIPIHSNFGYIMQLYALQTAISRLGHEAYTIQLKLEPQSYSQRFVYLFKSLAAKYLLHHNADPFRKFPTKKQMDYMDANTWDFINHHCRLTEYVPSADRLSALSDSYDAFVVGSDQVWRKRYSIDIPSFFFSFLKKGKKRIAYAASFGISENDYGENLTRICSNLLSDFSAVGVREKTAVKLCEQEFGRKAVQVLDPTLLLKEENYLQLIEDDKVEGIPSQPFMLLYVLDSNPEKIAVAEELAKKKGLQICQIKSLDFGKVGSRNIDKCVYPHISSWLYAFSHASYVVTDSFHGTAFSIIFRKQFLTFGNVSRGLDRMSSLLSLCNLTDRLYNSDFHDSDIDYKLVYTKLEAERKNSLQFLKENL